MDAERQGGGQGQRVSGAGAGGGRDSGFVFSSPISFYNSNLHYMYNLAKNLPKYSPISGVTIRVQGRVLFLLLICFPLFAHTIDHRSANG